MDNTTAFRDFLQGLGKSEVIITDDQSPNSVEFRIKHKNINGVGRKVIMDELMNHDLWLVSATPNGVGNDRQKKYKVVGGASPTRPAPLSDIY